MDALGRFYTTDIFSNLLVSNLKTITPKKVLDLGVGDASLSKAAYARWANANYYATEIETHKVKKIERNLSFIKVYNYDSLRPNLSAKLKIKFGTIDVAICNPPYIKVEKPKKYFTLFKEASCNGFIDLKRITSEIVFFAHNLKLLKRNGELGIIVSDSLITGKDFTAFRETILNEFDVRRIIQLPDRIFNKTEARTHIIFLSKTKVKNKICELYSSDETGKLSKKISVGKEILKARMDYQFHFAIKNYGTTNKTLNQIGAIIKRGKYSHKELKESRLTYFHSTDYKNHNAKISFKAKVADENKHYAANAGDILMCRVGKRMVGKVAFVNSGSVLISDCIYRITVPKKYRAVAWKLLSSELGQSWLKIYAHGVCAQVISKTDLQKFPL